ncbi:hypothetical protein V6R97_06930 [Chromohalobacter salexigens]|uniref:hypothetical protein n=1 Tax=Chromohalobacter israelensis TaxID=141390 RepID=UPI0032E913BE
MLELLNYFSDERNLKEGVESLKEIKSDKTREEVEKIRSDQNRIMTISAGLREAKNIYNKMEECYGESNAWLKLSKDASKFFKKYKEDKSPVAACFLFFYLYVLATEGYKFVSSNEGRLELHYALNGLKGIVSAVKDISKIKEINNMWSLYISEDSLELEEARRKKEVEDAVKSEVKKRMESVEKTVAYAEERTKEVENSLSDSLRTQNFVELSKGFVSLKEDVYSRIRSLARQAFYLKVAVLASTCFFVGYNIYIKSSVTFDQLPSLIAPGVLVAILIYFMRLVLKEKNSEKRRADEIENKIAIIAFIEKYVGFYADNKEKAEYAMNSFNDLIFNPISNTDAEEQDPKVYDGFEQIINLSKARGRS